LKQPRLFIFDEATSSLDSATEQTIQERLAEASRGTSTVIIAHRLSTVVNADEILVLEHGRIAERGSHAVLVARGGVYATLWQRQHRVTESADPVEQGAIGRTKATTQAEGCLVHTRSA
jgi:ATP-binding cassette subfamily B protein